MINEIKKVIVGGISYPFYSIDFSGGGTEKSRMTISFVNEGGVYSFPHLSSKTPVTISIGSFFSFTGYAVSATKRDGVGGQFLEVTYDDSSIILDQFFVGLKGKHGPGFNTETQGGWRNLILVGTEIDPCQGESTVPDLCSPCLESEEASTDIDCQKNKEYKILDVDYSFRELIAEISRYIPLRNVPSTFESTYRAQYTGTLRDVLSNWTSDYGWTFFWDQDGVVFVDLSTGIYINDSDVASGCSLEERTENISIEDNSSVVNISYFGQDGELKDYSCGDKDSETTRKVLLKPLTLEDILVKNGRIDPFISNYYETSLNFEKCAAISIYSELARDLFCLYYIYEITSAVAAETAMNDNSVLKLLGNLEIKNVCHATSANQISKAIYSFYLTPGSENTPFSDAEIAAFVERGAYFLVVEGQDTTKQKFLEFETALAENCIGKYWYRYFDTLFQNGVDFSAPDATSLNYYKRGSQIQFDFLKSLPDSLGSLSSFLREIQSADASARDNFFLAERNQAWVPPPKGGDTTTTFSEDIEQIAFKEVEKTGIPDNLLLENYKIFIVFPKTTTNVFNVGDAKSTINPIDAPNVDIPFNEYRIEGVYGLRTARTRAIPIQTKRKTFDIIMPSQGGFTPGTNYGGYSIIVKGKTGSNNVTVEIPKTEIVVIDTPATQEEYITSVQVNYRNITNYNLANLTTNCTIDKSRIYAYANDLLRELKSAPIRPKRTITYSIAGLPNRIYNLSDGLVNFSIRLDSGGTKTTLTFSEYPPINKSETLSLNQIEFLLKNPAYKKYVQNYIKEVSIQQRFTEI